jgi:predicted signal transduction protein with EAL and GGDEF domain
MHASSPQQLIASADTAMYEAKAANKNCIRFSASLSRQSKASDEVDTPADISETDDGKAFS